MCDWNLVGGDPAPGDPSYIGGKGRDFGAIAAAAAEAESGFKRVSTSSDSSLWKGAAAEEFKRQLDGDVTSNLRKLSRSFEIASEAVLCFSSELQELRQRAKRLLDQACAAEHDRCAAASAESQRRVTLDHAEHAERQTYQEVMRIYRQFDRPECSTPQAREQLIHSYNSAKSVLERRRAELSHAKQRVESAVQNVSEAAARLKRASDSVRDVRDAHEAAARRCIKKLDEASDAGIKNKSFWQKACEWAKKNLTLDNIIKVLDVVSTILTVLAVVCAFIPFLQVVAGPLFAAAKIISAVSVGLKIFNKVKNGKGSWLGIGVEAVVALAPLGKVFKGAGAAGSGVGKLAKMKNAIAGSKFGGAVLRLGKSGAAKLGKLGGKMDALVKPVLKKVTTSKVSTFAAMTGARLVPGLPGVLKTVIVKRIGKAALARRTDSIVVKGLEEGSKLIAKHVAGPVIDK